MYKRGFTIFFAVLVSTLALSVGLIMYNLFVRSLELSQMATQSQFAIYASDSGAECALYWDAQYVNAATNNNGGTGSAFSTSSADVLEPTSGASCNGQDILLAVGSAPLNKTLGKVELATSATTTVWMSLGTTLADPCVMVEIGKSGNPSRTILVSHGYNTCAVSGRVRLERTLQINY